MRCPFAHEHADDVAPLPPQQQRRNAAVDTAGKIRDHAHRRQSMAGGADETERHDELNSLDTICTAPTDILGPEPIRIIRR